MREQPRDQERLLHIKKACDILSQYTDKVDEKTIAADPMQFYGIVKLVEIIGEATYKLTKEYRDSHPEIPWRMMEGMRHVLVHDYYRISPAQLLKTLKSDIPQLKVLIDSIV